MDRRIRRTFRWPSLLLAGTLLTATGCSRDPEQSKPEGEAPTTQSQAAEPGKSVPLESLPFIEPEKASTTSIQQLEKPNELDENVALHVRLPPPTNEKLKESLVRVLGEPESPVVLFRSDVLAELGYIPSSPGSDFFTHFTKFDTNEISRRLENEKILSSGKHGQVTDKAIVFNGRSPVAVTKGLAFDRRLFDIRVPQPVALCPAAPASTMQGWGESLFITSPAVVLNPQRTWDPCTGNGTQGGRWTFAHLIREMATTSGHTPEDFVLKWLEQWLNNQVINGDTVPSRTAMFNQVIRPWAIASGVGATLATDSSGRRFVQLSGGPLNLNIAPFRLLAIVNRLDLGATTAGSSMYGGLTTANPVDAGELRFIFGVVQPNPWGGGSQATCGLKPFTVIFEYGVPITGCSNVVQWARDWTQLNTFGGFTPTYLAHLESLTQRVVVHGAAPSKGNKSALNQLRTNERAIGSPWELREFTLTDEDPLAGTDTPSNGLLRNHTVAQTPDDTAYSSTSSAAIDAFVMGTVKPSVPTPAGPLPANCSASYTVPYSFLGSPFRGGNSFVPPNHWEAISANPLVPEDVCARHQFSLNTCNGCHFGDTTTGFTHISTTGIPATLSNFLTGTGPGLSWGVADTQFGAPTWLFADLEHRWKRLYEVAFCVQCTSRVTVRPEFVDHIQKVAQVVPIDPVGPIVKPPFEIGPIRDVGQVKVLLESRKEFAKDAESVPLDFIRRAAPRVH